MNEKQAANCRYMKDSRTQDDLSTNQALKNTSYIFMATIPEDCPRLDYIAINMLVLKILIKMRASRKATEFFL